MTDRPPPNEQLTYSGSINYMGLVMLKALHARLPASVQPFLEDTYYLVNPLKVSPEELKRQFISDCFSNPGNYDQYREDLLESSAPDIIETARSKYQKQGGVGGFAGTNIEIGAGLYALVREHQPEVIVETGVYHGTSTLFMLQALADNRRGKLLSIDYPDPPKADAEFWLDREPGWLIPDELSNRWELTLGKSQQLLPRAFLEQGEADIFVHDSEHTPPCMMMEFELAYHHLSPSGFILSDDIHWNGAWDTFVEFRESACHGQIAHGFGYFGKQ